ncbi:MAG: D-glycerate dehydrogenase [Myxococcota bacterium]
MNVLITQEIDESGVALLDDAGLTVQIYDEPQPIPRAILLEMVRGCDALISMPTDSIDAEVMDTGPIQIVAQHAVGYDNIDLDAARTRGVVVTNTPGVLTAATADLTMGLLLALGRRLIEADAYARAGNFPGWRPTLLRGVDLDGAQLGIVGMGRIGRAVAHRAEAFGMSVVHHSRSGGIPLDALLETSDVVSLHCPLTPETRHLIDAAALERMKPSALLINTARGPVVDEDALAAALEEGRIAGAALDVFEHEPLIHLSLLELDNVVLAPHIGSATWKTRRRMATLAAQNLLAFASGEPPPNQVS